MTVNSFNSSKSEIALNRENSSFSRLPQDVIPHIVGYTGDLNTCSQTSRILRIASQEIQFETLEKKKESIHLYNPWETPFRKKISELKHLKTIDPQGRGPAPFAMGRDETCVVSSSKVNMITVFNMKTGHYQELAGHTGAISCLGMDLHRDQIISGSRDQTLKIWNMDGNCLYTLKGHTSDIFKLAVDPNGKYLVSVSSDTTKVWDLKNKAFLHDLSEYKDEGISCEIHPTKPLVIMASRNDHSLKVWDLNSKEIYKNFANTEALVQTIAFSPCGKYMFLGLNNGVVRMLNFESGEKIRELKQEGQTTAHTNVVSEVKVDANGKYILSLGRIDHRMKIWDVGTGKFLQDCDMKQFTASIGISRNAEVIVSSTLSGCIDNRQFLVSPSSHLTIAKKHRPFINPKFQRNERDHLAINLFVNKNIETIQRFYDTNRVINEQFLKNFVDQIFVQITDFPLDVAEKILSQFIERKHEVPSWIVEEMDLHLKTVQQKINNLKQEIQLVEQDLAEQERQTIFGRVSSFFRK